MSNISMKNGSIASISPVSVETDYKHENEKNGVNMDKRDAVNASIAFGKDQRVISLDSFDTPGNLMDDRVQDLDVDHYDDSDDDNIITKGEFIVPSTPNDTILSGNSVLSDKVLEGQ